MAKLKINRLPMPVSELISLQFAVGAESPSLGADAEQAARRIVGLDGWRENGLAADGLGYVGPPHHTSVSISWTMMPLGSRT